MRGLRGRLRRISLHWPRFPETLGVIIGDFNICELEEGRFNVTNQTFTESDAGQKVVFRSFSRTFLKSRNQHLQGRILPLMVRFAHYPESTEHSLTYLWQSRVTFIVTLMFLTTLVSGPWRQSIGL